MPASLFLLLRAPLAIAQSAAAPSIAPTSSGLHAMTDEGCYSLAGSLQDQGSYLYQTQGYCQTVCTKLNKPVGATTRGSNCFCGDLLPPQNGKTDNDSCNTPCNGYGFATCGGQRSWSVFLTGLENSVGSDDSASTTPTASSTSTSVATSASMATHSTSQSVVTEAGQTIIVTAPGQATPTKSSQPANGGGPSKAAVAAGVVVGVIIIAALIGCALILARRQRRKAVEEEYKRNAAANRFVAADKPEARGSPTPDQRLDPSIMQHRRLSDGSIADNVDFSRRILQVDTFFSCLKEHR